MLSSNTKIKQIIKKGDRTMATALPLDEREKLNQDILSYQARLENLKVPDRVINGYCCDAVRFKDAVAEWNRAVLCKTKYPHLLSDEKAYKAIEQLDRFVQILL